jgi:hypothetical protein
MAEHQSSATTAGGVAILEDQLALEVDEYDHDAVVDTKSVISSATSIASSVMKYREENGRTYHAYKVWTTFLCFWRLAGASSLETT